ncbi:LSM domain-containing protein [Aureococcus anophagefferens]|nr:LSM domain-containing protein [Aureococcus anophagefferens]
MHSAESISGGPSGLLGRRAQRMHKGRHICRAASMARISGRERASLVRRVGAAVERHAPKIMKMSMLVGAMACLAGTRSSSCMPRPVDLDETLEPTFTDGARKYWHLRFTCPCSEDGDRRKYLRKLSDGDDVEKEKEAALERLWAGLIDEHGEHLGLGVVGGDGAMDEDAAPEEAGVVCQPCSPPSSPGAKRGRVAAQHPTPQSMRDAREAPAAEPEPARSPSGAEPDDGPEPPLPPAPRPHGARHARIMLLSTPTNPCSRDRTAFAAALRRQYDSTPRQPAAARGPVVSSDRIDEGVGSSDSSDEGCAGCAKCVTKDALLREADMEIQSLRAKLSTPGAAWAKTVEALPNRTQGMAKKGLALMARLEPTSTPRERRT